MLEKINMETYEKASKNSNSFPELCRQLGFDPKKGNIRANVERKIKRLGIDTSHFESVKKRINKWDKYKIIALTETCSTYTEILLAIDYLAINTNFIKLKKLLKEWNIDFKGDGRLSSNYEKNFLLKIVSESYSYRECLRKLNINSVGGNHTTLKKYIELYKIDISHFDVKKCFGNKKNISEYLQENCDCSRTNLKRRLFEEGYLENKCCLCGQDDNWNNMKISLIIDHINGISNDNRIENLRIVCPNCNAGLDTFAGKNNKKKNN